MFYLCLSVRLFVCLFARLLEFFGWVCLTNNQSHFGGDPDGDDPDSWFLDRHQDADDQVLFAIAIRIQTAEEKSRRSSADRGLNSLSAFSWT